MSGDFVEIVESILPPGWNLHDPDMAPDCLLEAPDGCVIEPDGRCSHGLVSPLIEAGLI